MADLENHVFCRVDLDKIEWNDQAVRYAIVKLLKEVNQITLAKICPLPQVGHLAV